jgi:hydrogenase maturation protease
MSEEGHKKILVIGIGNTGRQDDGLGWLVIDHILEDYNDIRKEYRYQLQIEDAELVSHYSKVIFVDATKEQVDNGFYLKPCKGSIGHGLSSHALHPETILGLTNELYDKYPEAFILGIQGYYWGLQVGISEQARVNFKKTINALPKILSFDTENDTVFRK